MEFLIILLLIIGFANFLNVMQEHYVSKEQEQDKIPEKVCPPHRWRHHEVKDKDGNVEGWRLVCDICGPLKPQELPDRKL